MTRCNVIEGIECEVKKNKKKCCKPCSDDSLTNGSIEIHRIKKKRKKRKIISILKSS